MGHISELPAKVIVKILSLLPHFDKKRAQHVCTSWRRVIARKFGLVRELMWPTDHENNSIRDEALSTYQDLYLNNIEDTATSTLHGDIFAQARQNHSTSYSRANYHYRAPNYLSRYSTEQPTSNLFSNESSYSHMRRPTDSPSEIHPYGRHSRRNVSGRNTDSQYSPLYSTTSSSSSSVVLTPVHISSYQAKREKLLLERQQQQEIQSREQYQYPLDGIQHNNSNRYHEETPEYNSDDNGEEGEDEEELTAFTLPRQYRYIKKRITTNPKISASKIKSPVTVSNNRNPTSNTSIDYLESPATSSTHKQNRIYKRNSNSVTEVPDSPGSPILSPFPHTQQQRQGVIENEPVKPGFQYKNMPPFINDQRPNRMKPPMFVQQKLLLDLEQQQLPYKKYTTNHKPSSCSIEKYKQQQVVNNNIDHNYQKFSYNTEKYYERLPRDYNNINSPTLEDHRRESNQFVSRNNYYQPSDINYNVDSVRPNNNSYHSYGGESRDVENTYTLNRKERQDFQSVPSHTSSIRIAPDTHRSSIYKFASGYKQKPIPHVLPQTTHEYNNDDAHSSSSYHHHKLRTDDTYRSSSYLRNNIIDEKYKHQHHYDHAHDHYKKPLHPIHVDHHEHNQQQKSNTKGKRTGLVAHHLHYHPLPPGFDQADIDKFLAENREADSNKKTNGIHQPKFHHMKARREDVKRYGSSNKKIIVTKRKKKQ